LGKTGYSKILQSKRSFQGDFKETRSNRELRKDQSGIRNITTKGTMETQYSPDEPGKPSAPGQQGGQQQGDRERQERERQQREREKQGGGGGQERGGGQQGGGQQGGR
jgi:hypothetical protein